MATTRAKFRCTSVEQSSAGPYTSKRYAPGTAEPTDITVFPRTYKLVAVTDDGTPENERYNMSTPSGTLTIGVDNPAVSFEPGKAYYLDFTPTD